MGDDRPADDESADDESADDVLGLLSDGTRVDVLRAVARAQYELDRLNGGPVELAFSEIYDRVDVDNTSKLSYHLGELTGTFLRRSEDGYALTHAGEQIVRFVLSRGYEKPAGVGPRETAGTCLFCGAAALEAVFREQFFYVECSACESPVAGFHVTPAQARSWEGDELIRRVAERQAHEYRQARRGTCPECAAELSTEVRDLRESPLPDADPFVVIDECESCLRRYSGPMTYGVAYHPASVAFHWDRGVDVTAKGLWEFHDHLREGRWTAERVATDPDAYEVVLRRGDDALRVRLDSTAAVARTERVRRREALDRQ